MAALGLSCGMWNQVSCRGPALVGSRDSLRRTVSVTERNREIDKERILQLIEERKEADIPWFMQKANKNPAQDFLCSCRPQAPSRIAEGAPP